MRNRILITSAAAVVAAGVLLGTAACGTHVEVEHGTSSTDTADHSENDDRGAFGASVESGDVYSGAEDVAAGVEAGELPAGIPTDVTTVKRTVVDGVTYVSWKGGQIAGDSCTFDADADAPSMPGFVKRATAPERGVTTCDVGKQASGGEDTYFWKK